MIEFTVLVTILPPYLTIFVCILIVIKSKVNAIKCFLIKKYYYAMFIISYNAVYFNSVFNFHTVCV